MIFYYLLILLIVLIGIALLLYFLFRPSPSQSNYTSLNSSTSPAPINPIQYLTMTNNSNSTCLGSIYSPENGILSLGWKSDTNAMQLNINFTSDVTDIVQVTNSYSISNNGYVQWSTSSQTNGYVPDETGGYKPPSINTSTEKGDQYNEGVLLNGTIAIFSITSDDECLFVIMSNKSKNKFVVDYNKQQVVFVSDQSYIIQAGQSQLYTTEILYDFDIPDSLEKVNQNTLYLNDILLEISDSSLLFTCNSTSFLFNFQYTTTNPNFIEISDGNVAWIMTSTGKKTDFISVVTKYLKTLKFESEFNFENNTIYHNGSLFMVWQPDGNVCIRQNMTSSKAIWVYSTDPPEYVGIDPQTGDYTVHTTLWTLHTNGQNDIDNLALQLQGDGNLVLRRNGDAIAATTTALNELQNVCSYDSSSSSKSYLYLSSSGNPSIDGCSYYTATPLLRYLLQQGSYVACISYENSDGKIICCSASTCTVYLGVLQKIQNQINSIFVTGEPVGPVDIQLQSGTDVTGPPEQDFTIDVSDIPLPDFVKFNSGTASIVNSKSTWDNIFLSVNDGVDSPLMVQQTQDEYIIASTTGYPVCSNLFIKIGGVNFGSIVLQGLDTLTLNNTAPSECINLGPGDDKSDLYDGKKIVNDFSLQADLNIFGNGNVGLVEAFSSYCGIACGNPFEGCFYECGDLNRVCGDQLPLSGASGSIQVGGGGKITITGTVEMNLKYDPNTEILTVSNIQLNYTNLEIPGSFARVTLMLVADGIIPFDYQIDLTSTITEILQTLFPDIINLLNNALQSEFVQIPIDL